MFKILQTLSPLPKRVSTPPEKYSPPSQAHSSKVRKTKSDAKSEAKASKQSKGRKGPTQSVVKSKIKATQRAEKIHIKPTDGGHVVTLQAGTYEVFKRVLCTMYEAKQQTLCGRSIEFGSPKENPISHVTTIPMRSNGVQYTLNLYHSTCRLLANGKSPQQFYQDFRDIVFYIRSEQASGNIPLDDQVNEVLKSYLEDHLMSDVNQDSTQESQHAELPERRQTRNTRSKTAVDNSLQSTVRDMAIANGAENKSLSFSQPLAIQHSNAHNPDSNIVIEDLANVIQSSDPTQVNQDKIPDMMHASQPSDSANTNTIHLDSDFSSGDNFQDAPSDPIIDPEFPIQSPSHVPEPVPTNSQVESTNQPPVLNPPPPMQSRIPASRETHTAHTPEITGESGDRGRQTQDVERNDQSRVPISQPISENPDGPADNLSDNINNGTQSQNQRGKGRKQKKAEEEMTREELIAHLRKRETALQKKEETVRLKALQQENQQRDLANARAQIAMLEERVRELEQDKRDLNQKLIMMSEKAGTATPSFTQPVHVQPPAHPSNSEILHQMNIMQLESRHSNEMLQARYSRELMELRHSQEVQQIRFQNAMERITPTQPVVSNFPGISLPPYQNLQSMHYGMMLGSSFPLVGNPYMSQRPPQNIQPPRKPKYNTFIPNPGKQQNHRQQTPPEAPPTSQTDRAAHTAGSTASQDSMPSNSTGASRSASETGSPVPGSRSDAESRSSVSDPEKKEEPVNKPDTAPFLAQTHRTNHERMESRPQ